MSSRRTALVTGASRGIGRAVARRLAREYDVIAAARSEGQLRSLTEEIAGDGGRCTPLELDVGDAAAVESSLRGVEVDVLVNNAGVMTLKPMLELTLEEWHTMVDVNLNGIFYVTRAVLPSMTRRGQGAVVNIGSLAGRNTFAGGTCYAATKHAVLGLTESLMLEVRDRNVRVLTVMPGSVATTLRTSARFESGTDPQWMLAPDDVAEAVAYALAQPANVLVSRVELRPNSTKWTAER
jgi:NADP-dependent 3-hydroxy acid dehydrogenase YdfG